MQLVAKLVQLLPVQTGEGKNGQWKKQDVIVETDGQYPKKVCISIWGDKINEAALQVGAMLDIQFDVESREYNSRWYTDCKAWSVKAAGAGATSAPAASTDFSQIPPPSVEFNGSDDGMPF